MLNGYVDFFMDPNLADCYLKLKEELDKLLQKKVSRYWFCGGTIPCLLSILGILLHDISFYLCYCLVEINKKFMCNC